MMQNIDHNDIGRCASPEWKVLGVSNAIKPGRELDVRRYHVSKSLLEVTDAATNLNRKA